MVLLYIWQLSISFVIGQKHTVHFQNQHLWRDLATDYTSVTIILSRTLEVTGNHVMHDCGAWYLRIIMSSLHTLCCLPSVKKQKHDFHFWDHVYYWHPRSSVDRYWRSTPRSTRDRHSIDISVDPWLAHGRHLHRQTFNFRWHSIEWRSILAMTTHWMSVVCQWCIGSLSVMYSSQYPSSLVGTPLYGLYRYVRPLRVWFFSPFGHKLGIDFSHFAAILVINRVSIFAL